MSEENSPENKSKPKLHPLLAKMLWPLVILGAIGFGWFAYVEWQYEKNRISTDNAQVESLIVKIFSPEQGYIETVDVNENDYVTQDQALVNLDNDYYQWEVDRAQANFNLLQAKIGSGSDPGLSSAQLQSAEANQQVINAQLDQARSDLTDAQDEVSDLEKRKDKPGFVQSDLTRAQTQVSELEAKVNTLEKQALLADKQLVEEQANQKLVGYNLNQAKAELEQAKLRLANTVIKSPINGYVAQKNVSAGLLVQPSQYLMSVISLSDVWITANIKESQIERIKIGYPVVIKLDAFTGETFYGEVESISPATGSQFSLIPKNNAAGNFIKTEALIPVRIKILEEENKARMLPGMSASVTILTDPLNDEDAVVKQWRQVKDKLEKDEAAKKSADNTTSSTDSADTTSTPAPATTSAPATTAAPKSKTEAVLKAATTAAPASSPEKSLPAADTPPATPSDTTQSTPTSDSAPTDTSVSEPASGTNPVTTEAAPHADSSDSTKQSALNEVTEKANPGSVGTDGK